MNFIDVGLALLCMCGVAAELDGDEAKKALEWGSGGMSIRRGGPLDMRLGVAVKSSKLLEKERLYHPETNGLVDPDRGRNCYKDAVYDEVLKKGEYKTRFLQVLIDMFPSPDISLSPVIGNMDESFYYAFKERLKADEERAKFLAALMVMCLGSKKTECAYESVPKKRSTLTIKHDGEKLIEINLSHKQEKLKTLNNVVDFFSKGIEHGSKIPNEQGLLLSKEILLQVYMCFMFNTENEVKEFYEWVCKLTKGDDPVRKLCFVEGKDSGAENETDKVFDQFLTRNSTTYERVIPFLSSESIAAGIDVRRYSSDSKDWIDGAKFRDCMEVTILSFLCCLFYVPENGCYDLSKCGNKTTNDVLNKKDLIKFFENLGNKPFTLTEKVRQDWIKIVGDIKEREDRIVKENGIVNEDNRITYCLVNEVKKAGGQGEDASKSNPDVKGQPASTSGEVLECRNELMGGWINLMKVVVHITGLKWEDYLSDFPSCINNNIKKRRRDEEAVTETEIADLFKKQFEKLINDLRSPKVNVKCNRYEPRISYDKCKVSLKTLDGKETVSSYPYWDVNSTIILNFTYKNEHRAAVELNVKPSHGSIRFTNSTLIIPKNTKDSLRSSIEELEKKSISKLKFGNEPINKMKYFVAVCALKSLENDNKLSMEGKENKINSYIKDENFEMLFIDTSLETEAQKLDLLGAISPQFQEANNGPAKVEELLHPNEKNDNKQLSPPVVRLAKNILSTMSDPGRAIVRLNPHSPDENDDD